MSAIEAGQSPEYQRTGQTALVNLTHRILSIFAWLTESREEWYLLRKYKLGRSPGTVLLFSATLTDRSRTDVKLCRIQGRTFAPHLLY